MINTEESRAGAMACRSGLKVIVANRLYTISFCKPLLAL